MYARMVIGEIVSEKQVSEFSQIYASNVLPDLEKEHGFEYGRFLVEDGGKMAVALTVWKTKEDCLRYHSGRSYRQFVTKTQHLLVGNFVVKLFREGAP